MRRNIDYASNQRHKVSDKTRQETASIMCEVTAQADRTTDEMSESQQQSQNQCYYPASMTVLWKTTIWLPSAEHFC